MYIRIYISRVRGQLPLFLDVLSAKVNEPLGIAFNFPFLTRTPHFVSCFSTYKKPEDESPKKKNQHFAIEFTLLIHRTKHSKLSMSDSESITYEVIGKAAVITLNNPRKLNSLTLPQYDELARLISRANDDENTIITLLQSTGRAFSAGADAKFVGKQDTEFETWLRSSLAMQVHLTQTIMNHKKILAVALNGFAIGLSAALIMMCDLVYVHDVTKTFLLAPFPNIGIVAEGGSSATFPVRLGWSKAAEALLLSKRISGEDMLKSGLINKAYDGKFSSAQDFNKTVLNELLNATESLHPDSILEIKELLKANFKPIISYANSQESYVGLTNWTSGMPLERFKKLSSGELKHKM